MESNRLEICVQFQIQGSSKTPHILRRAIEQFLAETVVPLTQDLAMPNEKITVTMEIIETKLDKKK